MNILLTNDDGYTSMGIRALAATLSEDHSVYICAPLKQMSATSHAIHLFQPLELQKIKDNEYALDGSPADCVKVALIHLFKDVKFDIVLSGINNGPNMGEDIFYSGTVAAAREGLLNGVFSIAASLDCWTNACNYNFAARYMKLTVENLSKELLNEKIMLNINFPNRQVPLGTKTTLLGERVYRDDILTEVKDGKTYVSITGDDPSFKSRDESDLNAVSEGFVSITPLELEIREYRLWKEIKELETTLNSVKIV